MFYTVQWPHHMASSFFFSTKPDERKELQLCRTDVSAQLSNQITQTSSEPWARRTTQILIERQRQQQKHIRLNKAATSWNLVGLWGPKMKEKLTSQWRLKKRAAGFGLCAAVSACASVFHENRWIYIVMDLISAEETSSMHLGTTRGTEIQSQTLNFYQFTGSVHQVHTLHLQYVISQLCISRSIPALLLLIEIKT